MQKITKYIDKTLAKFLIALMALMVLAVTWQVVTRFLMHDPSSFTEEAARFLLIWIGLLGAAWALRTRAHLGIDILTHRLTGLRKQITDISVYVIIILFSILIMIIGGTRLVLLTLKLNHLSASMGIKMGYIYTVIPLSGLLMVWYSVLFIIEAIGKRVVSDTKTGGQ